MKTLSLKFSAEKNEIFGRHITILFRRIQRLQICKIPTDVIGTLTRIVCMGIKFNVLNNLTELCRMLTSKIKQAQRF